MKRMLGMGIVLAGLCSTGYSAVPASDADLAHATGLFVNGEICTKGAVCTGSAPTSLNATCDAQDAQDGIGCYYDLSSPIPNWSCLPGEAGNNCDPAKSKNCVKWIYSKCGWFTADPGEGAPEHICLVASPATWGHDGSATQCK